MTLFKNKYRVESIRLQGWDYSSDGYYFVTICTGDRKEYFGEIRNGIMGLNEMGCKAAKYWQEIPDHFDNVELDQWVIMPNHIHGVVIIENGDYVMGLKIIINSIRRDAINRVSTDDVRNNVKPSGGATGIHNPMGKKTLGEIIRWFKGRTTFEIRKSIDPNFAWQPRFYDHIIRNDDGLYDIQEYILNNPLKWEEDRNNPENLWM